MKIHRKSWKMHANLFWPCNEKYTETLN